jgi:hypothetical protein
MKNLHVSFTEDSVSVGWNGSRLRKIKLPCKIYKVKYSGMNKHYKMVSYNGVGERGETLIVKITAREHKEKEVVSISVVISGDGVYRTHVIQF